MFIGKIIPGKFVELKGMFLLNLLANFSSERFYLFISHDVSMYNSVDM